MGGLIGLDVFLLDLGRKRWMLVERLASARSNKMLNLRYITACVRK
jgi:hypothetical protein